MNYFTPEQVNALTLNLTQLLELRDWVLCVGNPVSHKDGKTQVEFHAFAGPTASTNLEYILEHLHKMTPTIIEQAKAREQ